MRLHVEAADLGAAVLRLNRLAGRLGDLSEPMRAIGGILESSARYRISHTKTAPDGSPWRPLLPATRQRKGNGNILVDLGTLMRGLTHEAGGNSVIAGSPMMYAVFLQEGTRHMAARPFLGISAQDARDIDELLADWLAEGLDDGAAR